MLKTDIIWPNHRRYKSRTEWEPIGFFSDCLCNSTQFDLMLGFFSSSAINVLANGFATFLYNGGRMRLIINDILTEDDKNAIIKGIDNDIKLLSYFDLSNIKSIYNTLSKRDKHFFECIAWLIRNDRIEIKIIAPKNGIGISHTKSGIFYDGMNKVGFDGSCNFSRTALVDNIESLTTSCDWDGSIEIAKIESIKEDFESIISEKDKSVSYVSVDNIKTQIINTFENKSLVELIESENNIINTELQQDFSISINNALNRAKKKVESIIEKLNSNDNISIEEKEPCFPYPSGPRDYQKEAFEKWKSNGQKGLFAMATGTGKTITSLNCLLEIYNKLGYYKAIILVPTITLVEQWESECKKFNFKNIIKVCSKYNNWRSLVSNLSLLEARNNNDNNLSYIIISTYASYVRSNIFYDLNLFPKNKLLIIADEAHNIGSGLMVNRLSEIKYLRRIGLSATPERQYDLDGNRKIMNFFGCENNYTFEYSMREAIDNGALCRYYYYPHIVKLTDYEMRDYIEISKKIVKIMEFKDEDSHDALKYLLLKRKRIIHKAVNKLDIFKQIIEQRIKEKGDLKYTLVYVPEGNKPDDFSADIFDKSDTIPTDTESEHLIDEFTSIVRDMDPHLIVRKFTSESKDRDDIIKGFADGSIDVLTSMKCLDEGVDIPRSEFAIFCASTGNPRQFIQRRGRVLRTHKDKKFAIIHDLIVIPDNIFDQQCYTLEKSLVEGELKRVRDFAELSENINDTENELHDVLNHYNLSIFK